MLPLALLAGGRYRATTLTDHARTNASVIDAFLPGAIELAEQEDGSAVVSVAAPR
jgi:RNA 3'-terminal phosphate cyclase